jgi:hypothetical protein
VTQYEPNPRHTHLTEAELAEGPRQEWGGVEDVKRTFDLGKTVVYARWRDDRIKGAIVYGTDQERGKRLFNFASIRRYIAECEKQGGQVPLPKGMNFPGDKKET